MSNFPPKDPNDVLDYLVDWSAWLSAGDTIASSAWIVPTGLTKESDGFTATTAVVWLSGGTDKTRYSVTNRITTTQGRTKDKTIYIQVQHQ